MKAVAFFALLAGSKGERRHRLTVTETVSDERRCVADFASETRSACELYTDLMAAESKLAAVQVALGGPMSTPMLPLVENDVVVSYQGRRKIIMVSDPAQGYTQIVQKLVAEYPSLDDGHDVHLEFSFMGGPMWIENDYDMQAFLRIPRETRSETELLASIVNTEMPTHAPTYTNSPTETPTNAPTFTIAPSSTPTKNPTTIYCGSIFPSSGIGYSFATLYQDRITVWGGQEDKYEGLHLNHPTEERYAQFDTGHSNICAVRLNEDGIGGDVDCWGVNNSVRTTKPSRDDLVQVSVGYQNACALAADGDVFCWGTDNGGAVSDAPKDRETRYLSCTNQACCRIKTDDTITCWGANNGSVVSNAPSGQFEKLTCGYNYICCALSSENGRATCWGSNSSSVVSNAVTDQEFESISCGRLHCCAITPDNTMSCWGYNGHGQVSNLPHTDNWLEIGTSYYASCGLNTNYRLECWGLMNGDYVPSEGPMYDYDFTCGV